VMSITGIWRIHFGTRGRKAFEAISHEYPAMRVTVSLKYASHVDACATPPYARFDEVARNFIHNDRLTKLP